GRRHQDPGLRDARAARRADPRPDLPLPRRPDLSDHQLSVRRFQGRQRPLRAAEVRQHLHPPDEPHHRRAGEADRRPGGGRRRTGLRVRAGRRDRRHLEHRPGRP
ncbi:MAG: O-acetylhomoserine sulfhydrylase / O-succinylhomoserine sulfhydrylase, partial [uncultured Thermomicrobiales bacterium]